MFPLIRSFFMILLVAQGGPLKADEVSVPAIGRIVYESKINEISYVNVKVIFVDRPPMLSATAKIASLSVSSEGKKQLILTDAEIVHQNGLVQKSSQVVIYYNETTGAGRGQADVR